VVVRSTGALHQDVRNARYCDAGGRVAAALDRPGRESVRSVAVDVRVTANHLCNADGFGAAPAIANDAMTTRRNGNGNDQRSML
jgi:hypothetical protein